MACRTVGTQFALFSSLVLIAVFIWHAEAHSTCEGDELCNEEKKSEYRRLPECEDNVQQFGAYRVNVEERDLAAVESRIRNVEKGGRWMPEDCTAKQKIAVIVPYRRREQDLPVFLDTLHPFLQKQQAHYGIYIVHQADEKHFNRGSLLNVGFTEAMKDEDYDCIILHDVDKWPEDTSNIYRCTEGTATHLIGRQRHVYQQYRKRPYDTYFGGVTAISRADFHRINGFSNYFWGWGSEDDDLLNRMKSRQLLTSRADDVTGSYVESYQPYGFVNPRRHEVVKEGKVRYDSDGLNSLQYELVEKGREPLYTNISIHLLREDPYENYVKPGA